MDQILGYNWHILHQYCFHMEDCLDFLSRNWDRVDNRSIAVSFAGCDHVKCDLDCALCVYVYYDKQNKEKHGKAERAVAHAWQWYLHPKSGTIQKAGDQGQKLRHPPDGLQYENYCNCLRLSVFLHWLQVPLLLGFLQSNIRSVNPGQLGLEHDRTRHRLHVLGDSHNDLFLANKSIEAHRACL